MSGLEDLYHDVILDHGTRPRGRGRLDSPTSSAEGNNPMCGDRVEVEVRIEDETIAEVGFTGDGCAICLASASMMTQGVTGHSRTEARDLFERFRAHVTEDGPPDGLGSLEALGGVRRFPMRVKCATLAWHALMHAIG